MKIITAPNGVIIKLYSSGKEAPAKRFNELQKYQLIESGIGSDIEAANSRYMRLHGYITTDDKEAALKEAENARHCIASILAGSSYTSYSFACMMAEMDGVAYNDLTEEGLERTIQAFWATGITQQEIEDAVNEVKKKIADEIEQLFPGLSDNIETLLYYSKLKDWTIQMGAALMENDLEQIAELDKAFIVFQTYNKPLDFNTASMENIILRMDRNFAEMCSMMESNGSSDPDNYTVVQYHSKMDYLQKSVRKMQNNV